MAVAELYARLRYGPTRDAAGVAELARRVRDFGVA